MGTNSLEYMRAWKAAHRKQVRAQARANYVPHPRPVVSLEERFWSKVDKTGECWLWTAGTVWGYGMFRIAGRAAPARAHRVAWELTNGPIPDGASVCHACDNPSCVRPFHLFLGTVSENLLDASHKGRLNPVSLLNLRPGAAGHRGAAPQKESLV
jgi:HNH endonuclease